MLATKIGLCSLTAVTLLCASAIAQEKSSPAPKAVYALQEGETIANGGLRPMIGAYGDGQVFLGLRKGESYFAVSGSKRSGPFAKLSLCSANETGLAYFVRKPDGGSYFVIRDKEYGPSNNEEGSCSLDEAGFSFTAKKDDGKWYANLNGKEFGPFDKEPGLAATEGGYSLVFQKADGATYVSINGAEYGPYKRVDYMTLVKSGFIYTAQKGDDKWYVIVNGKESGPYEFAGEASMDSAGFGYSVEKAGKKHYAVIYGKEYECFSGSCMSLCADFYDSGAWYFSQLIAPDDEKSQYGIRLSDGTIVKESIAGSQILDKGGKPYCVWFTRKGDDIYYNEKEVK